MSVLYARTTLTDNNSILTNDPKKTWVQRSLSKISTQAQENTHYDKRNLIAHIVRGEKIVVNIEIGICQPAQLNISQVGPESF